jgi:hypothetical protein
MIQNQVLTQALQPARDPNGLAGTVFYWTAMPVLSSLETDFLVVTSQCYNGFGDVSARLPGWTSIRVVRESYNERHVSLA